MEKFILIHNMYTKVTQLLLFTDLHFKINKILKKDNIYFFYVKL